MAVLTAGRVLAGCSIGALPLSVAYKDIWAVGMGVFSCQMPFLSLYY